MFQLTSNWSVHPSSSADKCPAPPCRTAQNQVLSAYCEATRAGCDAVRNIVLHASVCEVSNAADHSSFLPLPMGASMSCAMSLMSQSRHRGQSNLPPIVSSGRRLCNPHLWPPLAKQYVIQRQQAFQGQALCSCQPRRGPALSCQEKQPPACRIFTHNVRG